jgi:hypothetical protein
VEDRALGLLRARQAWLVAGGVAAERRALGTLVLGRPENWSLLDGTGPRGAEADEGCARPHKQG